MKKTLLFIYLLGFVTSIVAQTERSAFRSTQRTIQLEEQADQRMVYLFDEFADGVVYYPGNRYAEFKMNYRLLRDEFVVLYEGEVNALARSKAMDSLVVQGMVFVFDKRFGYLERMGSSDNPFYIKHATTYDMKELKQGAYGHAPASAVIENVNMLNLMEGQHINQSGEMVLENITGTEVQVSLIRKPSLLLYSNGNMTLLDSRRLLTRQFPDHSSEIRTFLRRERISFDEREDLLKLGEFLHNINQ